MIKIIRYKNIELFHKNVPQPTVISLKYSQQK